MTYENPLCFLLTKIPGVGQKTCERLDKIGANNIFQLLLNLPKKVILEQVANSFAAMQEGYTYIATGRVHDLRQAGRGAKQRLEIILRDNSSSLYLVYFGPAINYVKKYFIIDKEITISGEAKIFLGKIQMVHPKIYHEEDKSNSSQQVSQYPQRAGLNPQKFKQLINKTLHIITNYPIRDYLESDFIKNLKLEYLSQAIFLAHDPKTYDCFPQANLSPALRRLAFEELLSFYLRMFLRHKIKIPTPALKINKFDIKLIAREIFPFDLTPAQLRVSEEVRQDMSSGKPMARMIQGDVGSGKTAVSAIAALLITNSSAQVAVLAPTEILAEQLFRVYTNFLGKLCRISFLSSNTKTKNREKITQDLQKNKIDILIGTHALLSEDIIFNNLGLVIIDEQHRFGVDQRASLIKKYSQIQKYSPHLLVMSATPIPRSMALTLFGDLELSIIDQRPQGRIPIHTQIFSGDIDINLLNITKRILATKQKAFVIFPLVEESEFLDLNDATNTYKFLLEKIPETPIGLVHGRMKSDEKNKVMQDFKSGKIKLLISTTVVEVGVDIPDATCIIIVHAERFGLAQLHQLRGRVGRHTLKSYCFLLTETKNKHSPSYTRLQALCDTNDGFKLSEIDLKLRGPGEVLGTKQSGQQNFLIFNHADYADIIEPCKKLARKLSRENLDQTHSHLVAHSKFDIS